MASTAPAPHDWEELTIRVRQGTARRLADEADHVGADPARLAGQVVEHALADMRAGDAGARPLDANDVEAVARASRIGEDDPGFSPAQVRAQTDDWFAARAR